MLPINGKQTISECLRVKLDLSFYTHFLKLFYLGGSIWRPPAINPFAQGMPDELFSSDEEDDESRRRSLSKS